MRPVSQRPPVQATPASAGGWKRERIRGILAVVAGWTDFVVAHRGRILAVWLVAVRARRLRRGEPGRAALEPLQRARLRVRARARAAQGPHGRPLRRRVHARGERRRPPAERAAVAAAARSAAAAVEGGKAGPLLRRRTRRRLRRRSPRRWRTRTRRRSRRDVRRAIGARAGRADLPLRLSRRSTTTPRTIFNEDLARGESIAIPVALLVMVFMFGTLGGVAVPVAVRAR